MIFQAHEHLVLITVLICIFGGTPGVGVGILTPFLPLQRFLLPSVDSLIYVLSACVIYLSFSFI